MSIDASLHQLPYLTVAQKNALKRGNLQTVADLLLCAPQDFSRKCRLSPVESKAIFDAVCSNNPPMLVSLADYPNESDSCTTGDDHLDAALGGGFRSGMVWELFGEGGAGKTQLALQQALFVQLPVAQGGLAGAACYVTVKSALQTKRLMEIMSNHPRLKSEMCSLDDIQTIASPTIPLLLTILSKMLPDLISQRARNPTSKPVRLLVIDALADLFYASDKATTGTLVERSQSIAEIALLLHSLARSHNILVIIMNNTTDIFHTPATESGEELQYKQQSRWFNTAASIPGENNKEAGLGLVWANQINARIMMSRTGRRRFLDYVPNKRQKVDDSTTTSTTAPSQEDGTMIRRLSVVFSSIAPTCSLDFIITTSGVSTLYDGDASDELEPPLFSQLPVSDPASDPPLATQMAPLDIGFVEDQSGAEAEATWEAEYWNADDVPDDFYDNVDLDALVNCS
ncbi:RAD51b protein [Mycena kentingensis (nom. inval.)]|nr:RAD51b protein [Mycena kentingensis (nom. inval.)]